MLTFQDAISLAALDPVDADHPVWLCLLGYFRLLKNGQLIGVRSGGKTELKDRV